MDSITYTGDLSLINEKSLPGFFVGWLNPPSSETLFRLLGSSTHRVLAIDSLSGNCVGYVTALTDGVLFGYISSLEVLPEFQGRGIGQNLVSKILDLLSNLYAVDLVCDEDVQPFYERCGLRKCAAMVIRRPQLIDNG